MATSATKTSIIQSLPISQTDPKDPQSQRHRLRRRLSSLSLNIKPISSPSTSWVRRSKSISAVGDYAGNALRKCWDWSWSWILSRKPSTLTADLEMNEEQTKMLGCQSGGTWRHAFYKVRSEFRRLVGSDHLPTSQTFRYDSFSYAKNFDDGKDA